MESLDSFGDVKPSLGIMLAFLLGPRFPSLFKMIPNQRRKKLKALAESVETIAGDLLDRAAKERDVVGGEVDRSIIGTLSTIDILLSEPGQADSEMLFLFNSSI